MSSEKIGTDLQGRIGDQRGKMSRTYQNYRKKLFLFSLWPLLYLHEGVINYPLQCFIPFFWKIELEIKSKSWSVLYVYDWFHFINFVLISNRVCVLVQPMVFLVFKKGGRMGKRKIFKKRFCFPCKGFSSLVCEISACFSWLIFRVSRNLALIYWKHKKNCWRWSNKQ